MTIIGTYPPYPAGGGASPLGAVIAFAGSVAPAGWILCDGRAISRTGFSQLFAVIGTTYGAGDGSTTFNVPDLRGRAVYGVGPSTPGVASLGANEGQGNVALRGPHHGHSFADHSHGYYRSKPTDAWQRGPDGGPHAGDDWVGTGGQGGMSIGAQGYSVQNAPSHMGLNYIIRG